MVDMKGKYILALDQGTTSCRAIVFNKEGSIVHIEQKEFTQIFPKPGWVEHDPNEIWETQLEVFKEVIAKPKINLFDVCAIGITNQRETVVVWNADTGIPVYNAIVWQDKRTSKFCETLKSKGLSQEVRKKTGLVIDSYFSATKINWVLENVEGAKSLAVQGKLRFGTIDTWLIWKMTKGERFVTDYSNASRTMLYNIHDLKWDRGMTELLDIPHSMLPEVLPSRADFGSFNFEGEDIPISGVAGDQQAALFGQACHSPGDVKNTYGTGCFMLMYLGTRPELSRNGLLTTMACSLDGSPAYALEGSIFIAGAAVQWLRDGIKCIDEASDSEFFARKINSNDIFMVPAFAGLGAPYWDQFSRGAIFGLTRDTGKNHIIKATLQSIAYQVRDVLEAMKEDSGIEFKKLNVDGGATSNGYLMQFQCDLLDTPVDLPVITESTALGAAFLAGLQVGYWEVSDLKRIRKSQHLFKPQMGDTERDKLYQTWKKAVERTLNWLDH